jgi:hypothetical protein
MATYTSIHYAHKIKARAGHSTGAPLIISIDSDRHGDLGDELTLFTDYHELSRKLADAINAAVADHNAARTQREAA